MFDILVPIGDGLARTGLHLWVRDLMRGAPWINPALQTLHIISIALVVGSAGMISLRVLGLAALRQSPAEMARRLMPWFWTALLLLLLTGSLLVLNRPARYFETPLFPAKMLLLLVAIGVTLALRRRLPAGDAGVAGTARAVALASLALWLAIIFAGRWIAYV
jgi:hypothetical protein